MELLIAMFISGSLGYLFGMWSAYSWCQNVINSQENLIDDLIKKEFRH
jgi:hypothetical protein